MNFSNTETADKIHTKYIKVDNQTFVRMEYSDAVIGFVSGTTSKCFYFRIGICPLSRLYLVCPCRSFSRCFVDCFRLSASRFFFLLICLRPFHSVSVNLFLCLHGCLHVFLYVCLLFCRSVDIFLPLGLSVCLSSSLSDWMSIYFCL